MATKNKKNLKKEEDKTVINISSSSHKNASESSLKDGETKSSNVQKTPFAVVEAYKTIRTNLSFLLAQNEANSFAVSSSNAGEGKSTTAVNIAIAFSQLGDKVLLIDCDMRRSSVHKKLKLENETGLSNVLVGFSKFDDAVQKVSDSFYVLTAGHIPPNPSELLGSKAFEELMENAKKEYAYVILDTPPINVVSDALVVAPKTGGVILVVRDGITPNFAFKHALESTEFANINILGAVMNGTNPRSKRRYTYRKYGYGGRYYRYGYGKYGKYGYGKYGYGKYGYGGYGYGGYGSYGSYGSYGGYDNTNSYGNNYEQPPMQNPPDEKK